MKQSELNKMLTGELYFSSDSELISMRQQARQLTRSYNASLETETSKRTEILSRLFGKLGKRTLIEPPFHCDYGVNIFAGDDLFLNFGCIILDCARVQLGERVLLGPAVQIYTATHPLDARIRASGQELAKPVIIGNDVWLGGGTIVCPGTHIGDQTTIGAGSVVTKSIPANVFAAGNPCRVIREL